MTELYYKWIVREEAAELILKNHKRPAFVNGQPIVVDAYRKIRDIFRPFAGLFHLAGFSDEIRPMDKEKFNTTLIALNIGDKGNFKALFSKGLDNDKLASKISG